MSWLKDRKPKPISLAQSTLDYVISKIDEGLADLAYTFMAEENPTVFITTALVREAKLEDVSVVEKPLYTDLLIDLRYPRFCRVFRENDTVVSFETRGEAYERIRKLLLEVVKKYAEKSPNTYHNMVYMGKPYHSWKIFPTDEGFKKLNDLVDDLIKQAK